MCPLREGQKQVQGGQPGVSCTGPGKMAEGELKVSQVSMASAFLLRARSVDIVLGARRKR